MVEATKLAIQMLNHNDARSKGDNMFCDRVDRFTCEDRCAIVEVYQNL